MTLCIKLQVIFSDFYTLVSTAYTLQYFILKAFFTDKRKLAQNNFNAKAIDKQAMVEIKILINTLFFFSEFSPFI